MSKIRLARPIARHWRDFFVQIAAIAIGLLLALALDRVVGYFHERHQLAQARRDLKLEIEQNRRVWAQNVAEVERIQKQLEADLNLIQELQSKSPVTGKLVYSVRFYATIDGPWQAVRQNGSLSLMPNDELQTFAWFHGILTSIMDAMHTVEPVIKIGGAIAGRAPLDKLTERDLDELASKTSEAQGRLAFLSMFLQFERDGFDRLSGGAEMGSR
ncbi:MAG TPA: hypothetical protein VE086_04745 [Chthoniobacterales bacterium]|nr:hypothetical protein [Chthoniobacterales bacterium]